MIAYYISVSLVLIYFH